MKAHTLSDAVELLKPDRALSSPAELEAFFVPRPHSPLIRLEKLLISTRSPQKILFSGHRGTGKSTELAKLITTIEDAFFIVQVSAQKHMNLSDLTYTDVIFSIGLQLLYKAIAQDIDVKPGVKGKFVDFTKKISIEVSNGEKLGIEGGLEGGLEYLVKLIAKMKSESETRVSIRKDLQHTLSDLIENIDFLAKEIERVTGRRVLVVVEDLDKGLSLEKAKSLFYENAADLVRPNISVIYTFPIELRFDHNYMPIKNFFGYEADLPNIKILKKDRQPDPEGRDLLKKILTKRVEEKLFTPKALDLLIENCSGIPRDLISLAQQACLYALESDSTVMDEQAVSGAVRSRLREARLYLTSKQLDLLRKVAQNLWAENDEVYQPLLQQLYIMEYCNDDPWFDVHPIIKPLLEMPEKNVT
jgi:hypoxanthine-guanine phosphoribosyltransferase